MLPLIDARKIIIGVVVYRFLGIGIVLGQDTGNILPKVGTSYTWIGYAKFAKGNCTEYAASRRKDLFPSRSGKNRRFGGNAIARLPNAKRAGVPTGKTPKIGSIAVFGAGRGASSSYGHVAIVERIINENKIVISDMNYAGLNKITTRIISSKLALGYIYKINSDETDEELYKNRSNKKTNIVALHIFLEDKHLQIDKGSMHAIESKNIISIYQKNISVYQKNHNKKPINKQIVVYNINNTIANNREIIKNISKKYRTDVHMAMIIGKYKSNAKYWIDTS